MTIGQRIAYKRKEKNLSQEALGELLGVSRQSIYKWESDAALPEIDKLIALSKLFGVTVGSLLGVENETPSGGETGNGESEGEAAEERNLTEAQLKMVEEIVGRYLAAQPAAPASPSRSRRLIFKLCVAAAAVCLCVGLYRMSAQLNRLDSQYGNLQNSVSSISSSVSRQIGSITNRVEEILKAQNSLTADYETSLLLVNPETGTAVFTVSAVPKTYEEGMTVEFIADNDSGGTNRVRGEPERNQRFSATVASPLTDNISLSAVFVFPDGTRQTQLLEQYDGLYSDTLVPVEVFEFGSLFSASVSNGQASIPESYVSVRTGNPRDFASELEVDSLPVARLQELRVGLFKNKRLLTWLEPGDPPGDGDVSKDASYYYLPETSVPMAAGNELCLAAVYTDQFGRTGVASDVPCILNVRGDSLTWPDSYSSYGDPNKWSWS